MSHRADGLNDIFEHDVEIRGNTSCVSVKATNGFFSQLAVGTDNTTNLVHIKNSVNPDVLIDSSGGVDKASTLRFKNDAQQWLIGTNTDDVFRIVDYTNSLAPIKVLPSAPTNSFVIYSNGKIGMGTLTPVGNASNVLHIAGGSQSELHLTNNTVGHANTDGLSIQMWNNAIAYIWNRENASISLGTNGAEKARLSATGKFRVGEGNAGAYLEVYQSEEGTYDSINSGASSYTPLSTDFLNLQNDEVDSLVGIYMETIGQSSGSGQRSGRIELRGVSGVNYSSIMTFKVRGVEGGFVQERLEISEAGTKTNGYIYLYDSLEPETVSGGGMLFCSGGALLFKGGSGTVTPIADA